jgi:electron transport complex protein RnfC
MEAANGITNRLLTFSHGIHPEEYKDLSAHCKVERMPFVKEYVLPLSQHLGAPNKPLVQKGNKVKRGQKIGAANGFVSVALHAPVDGTVTDITLAENPNGQMVQSIIIAADPFSTQQLAPSVPKNYENMTVNEFISSIQESGIVGLGGAAFPAHVKFSIPEGKKCRYLILNGCECEPFLTSDHRTMVEFPDDVIHGTRILQHFINAEKIFIGIEANKPDAVSVLSSKAKHSGLPVEVVPLQVKYPQGAEKMMITAIIEKEVPSGKLPVDVEAIVSNISSIAAISQWFRLGQPLIERVVTVTGTAVKRPANVLVPFGTPLRSVVEFCGGITSGAARILLGGPMMGMVQKSLDTPVIKGTSGILILTSDEVRDLSQYNCIRCARCLEACPMFLNPSLLGMLAKKGLWDEMEENHVLDCFECGSCSYVCPSAIPLVQSFRVGKSIIREKKVREKEKVN